MKLIITLTLTACLISCHEIIRFDAKRVIVNDSDVQVRIEIYQDGNSIESISIPSGGINEQLSKCEDDVSRLKCTPDFRWVSIADSAQVFFDESRVQTFCGENMECLQTERNIFFFPLTIDESENATGYVKSMEDDVRVYTYTITNEDYENAEPIGD